MARKLTLKILADEINTRFHDLVAVVYPANHPLGGFCNTDRKIGRLRHQGRGRRGSRLIVSERGSGTIVFEHNAAETYRENSEVVDWIRRRKTGK